MSERKHESMNRLCVKWTTPYLHGQHLERKGEVILVYRSWGRTWLTVVTDYGTFVDILASEVKRERGAK